MNGHASFGDQCGGGLGIVAAQTCRAAREMTRGQHRSARRTGAAGDGPDNGGGYDSGGDGWSVFSWFSGGHSTSDHCGGSGDSGGGDCGGGDGGGGGGDGGGGD